MHTIRSHYLQAKRRLFLLDYDGTLTPLTRTPEDAKPAPQVLRLLERLSADPRNTVVIVSGRDHQTLDVWLGRLPLAFAAEHGFVYKERGGDWTSILPADNSWKESLRPRLQQAVDVVAGSFIEEKDSALCWHYRTAESSGQAQKTLEQLFADLPAVCERLNLRAIYGNKVVELQPAGVDKGGAAKHWLSQGTWDFVLAAGDDTTDEDLFDACPPDAFTVKVGQGETKAQTQFETVQSLVELLGSLPQPDAVYARFRRFVASYAVLLTSWLPAVALTTYMVLDSVYLGLGILFYAVALLPLSMLWGVLGIFLNTKVTNPKTRDLRMVMVVAGFNLYLIAGPFDEYLFVVIPIALFGLGLLFIIWQQYRIEQGR